MFKMLDKAECYLHEKFQLRLPSKFKEKMIIDLHLSFPVRSISRGIVMRIALTRNQSPFDAKTLSSLLKSFYDPSYSEVRSCAHM